MSWGFQDLLALFVVAAAAVYLVRRSWQTLAARRASGCAAGCSSCAAPSATDGPQLISVDTVVKRSASGPRN